MSAYIWAMDDTATDNAADALALDNQLCFSVYALSHAFNRAYRPLLEKFGLTYPQYLVMLALWENDEQLVGEIAGRLKLESNTVTPLLRRLEGQGLVTRSRSAADERQVVVSLTEQGKHMREEALEVPRQLFKTCGLDLSTLSKLRETLDDLRENLSQGAAGAGRSS